MRREYGIQIEVGSGFVLGLIILFGSTSPLYADFFTNSGGSHQASAIALEGLGRAIIGASKIENGDPATAKVEFSQALDNLSNAAKQFDALSREPSISSRRVDASRLSKEYIESMRMVFPKTPESAGEVLSYTSQSLSSAAKTVERFQENPTPENYRLVKNEAILLLQLGDVSTELLKEQ